MPWVDAPLCPTCLQTVTPKRGELATCLCKQTLVGIKPDGSLHVAGPEGVELVPVFVPFREQLELFAPSKGIR